jgi:hypothetical protein
VVVIILPPSGEPPRRRQAPELFQGQELVAQIAVEALNVAFLPQTAWVDAERLDADLVEPLP